MNWPSESQAEIAARVVAAYEESVERPGARRFTERLADGRAVPSGALDGVTDGVMAAYAERCERYLAFGREVQGMADGALQPRRLLTVLPKTPRSLLEIGCADLPVTHRQGAARREAALDKSGRGLGLACLKRLPELLERPVAIYATADLTHVVVLLEAIDRNGLPIVANVRPYGADRNFSAPQQNVVVGAYGKPTTAAALDGAAKEGRLLSVSQSRLKAMFGYLGKEVPESVAAQGDGVLRRLMAPPNVGTRKKASRPKNGSSPAPKRGLRPPRSASRAASSPAEERTRAHFPAGRLGNRQAGQRRHAGSARHGRA